MKSSDEERDPKRSRIFRACAQCVTAKTRCEEVNFQGCRSCRKKRKECSLVGLGLGGNGAHGGSNTSYHATMLLGDHQLAPHQQHQFQQPMFNTPPPAQSFLEDRLSKQETLLTTLESRIAQLESQVSSPLTRSAINSHVQITGHSPLGSSSKSPEYPYANPLVSLSPVYQLLSQITNLSTSYHVSSFPDVIALGYLSRETVDMAFQLCKHRVHETIPLDYFASTATPTPDHPFVVLAILQHTPSLLNPAILALLEESIALIMAGISSIDIVLGLLILSLAPETSVSQKPRPAPSRLIALAYEMCVNLGAHQFNVYDSPSTNIIDAREIWSIVQQKYIILNCVRNGRVNSILFGMKNYLQPVHYESTLIDIILQASMMLENLETNPHISLRDADEFNEQYVRLKKRWTDYRNACTGVALANALCAEYGMNMRFSAFVQSLPSPLADVRISFQSQMGNVPIVLRSLISLVAKSAAKRHSVQRDNVPTPVSTPTPVSVAVGVPRTTSLPAYITTAAASATTTMRRAAKYVLGVYPSAKEFVDLEELEEAEAILLASGGEAARLVKAAVEQQGPVSEFLPLLHTETPDVTKQQGSPDISVDLQPFFDFFNWDFTQPTLALGTEFESPVKHVF